MAVPTACKDFWPSPGPQRLSHPLVTYRLQAFMQPTPPFLKDRFEAQRAQNNVI